jgi:hypothetical protein
MKNWKKFAFVVLTAGSAVLFYASCATQSTAAFEQVPDGYVFAADAETLKNVRDGGNFKVTFVDLGGQKTVTPDVIKSALSNPARYTTLSGKATKVGPNRVKITTGKKLTVDVRQPVATFYGVNAKEIRDMLSRGRGAGETTCDCGGIPDMRQVTCTDPSSVLCCRTGC